MSCIKKGLEEIVEAGSWLFSGKRRCKWGVHETRGAHISYDLKGDRSSGTVLSSAVRPQGQFDVPLPQ